jgi:DNA-3-methyladenine glycosylase II
MKTILINTPVVFSFKECLKFLGRSENECLFAIENEKIRKLFVFEKTHLIVEFGLENDKSIKLSFLNNTPSDFQILAIQNYIENWLNLSFDLQPFYDIAKHDELLSPLIKKHFGLKLIGIPDFYEAICWAIIGQQINLNFAYTVKKNLVEEYGTRFEFEGKTYYQFPSPEKVLSISNEAFFKLKFSRQKVAYIRAISKNLADQFFDAGLLKTLDYETAKSKLLNLHGVGNWTADYVLMKTFRFLQAFPIQDAGLQNALKKALKLQKKPNLQTILQLSKPWKGFEAYATFYLWRSLYD